MSEIRKKFKSEVMTTFFHKISAKCTNFEISSLGRELQVWSIGLRSFFMKSRSWSRYEILTRSRSRRLRSRFPTTSQLLAHRI